MCADALDLFAGPGGFSMGLKANGLTELGFEWCTDASATAMAAGFPRVVADLATLDPREQMCAPGIVAGPPCQGFSIAGKGKSRDDSEALLAAIPTITRENVDDVIASLRESMTDDRSLLVLEPLRWVLLRESEWAVFEQVPAVKPIWEACAEVLRAHCYSVATGTVSAEQYGTPQVRKRAVLVARNDGVEAKLPEPTHSKYHARTPERLDKGVLPWVSMADALGEAYAGLKVRSNYGTGGDPRARGMRSSGQPAFTVTSKVDRNLWVPEFNDQSGTPFDREWPCKRPSTAVAGRGLVQNPGATANRWNGSTKSRNDGVRISVQEAGVLQGFPPDYPWQGKTTKQFEQAGNAVPVQLATALIRAATA